MAADDAAVAHRYEEGADEDEDEKRAGDNAEGQGDGGGYVCHSWM